MFCFSQPIGTKMALKFLKKKTTKLKSFLREYSISLYLSPCPFIINMFGIAFETEEYYVFAQEYAPSGDLFDIIPPQVMQRQLTSIMHMNKAKSFLSKSMLIQSINVRFAKSISSEQIQFNCISELSHLLLNGFSVTTLNLAVYQ